jgi:hypothetical protein
MCEEEIISPDRKPKEEREARLVPFIIPLRELT